MFTHRLASRADLPALALVAGAAIDMLQRPFLTPEQIAASRGVMGIDTQLIDDGTYFAVQHSATIIGCGGWSRRTTLFGGDHTSGRNAALLNPLQDAARIRAMYTAPDWARRGVGRLILQCCEQAAVSAGFTRAELAATRAGVPLYTACGYRPIEQIDAAVAGVVVPLVRMAKSLA